MCNIQFSLSTYAKFQLTGLLDFGVRALTHKHTNVLFYLYDYDGYDYRAH
jgi:hypothetical protein